MKRSAAVLLLCVLTLFAFAGCTGTEPAVNSPTSAPTSAPEETSRADAAASPTADADGLPEVYAGGNVFFIRFPDGSLYCWGNNEYGQLGVGEGDDREVPEYFGDGLTPVLLGDTVFALDSKGTLWGWGRNDLCQLGLGDTENRYYPAEIMQGVKTVGRSYDSIYALSETGVLYIWGADPGVNADRSGSALLSVPTVLMENVRFFDCENNIIITEGNELWVTVIGEWTKSADDVGMAWGWCGCVAETTDGKLFERTREGEMTLITESFVSMTFADNTAYIIMEDGSLWYYILSDRLGAIASSHEERQKLVKLMDGVKAFTADCYYDETWGYNYRFALKDNGELWSWGYQFGAALGRGDEYEMPDPALVAEGVESVHTNGLQTYLIKTDGSLWAAGLGDDLFVSGCVGNGSSGSVLSFVQLDVPSAADVVDGFFTVTTPVTAPDGDQGYAIDLNCRTFLVDRSGDIWAWGYNGDGLIGVRVDEQTVLSPVRILLTKREK